MIDKEIRSLLNELGHLPEKATDPNWVRTFEREELGLKSNERERRQTPSDHKAEQARFEKRRPKSCDDAQVARAELVLLFASRSETYCRLAPVSSAACSRASPLEPSAKILRKAILINSRLLSLLGFLFDLWLS